MNSLVIGLAGPTGVGKTEVALWLAKKLDGELISCDSVQVFKHLLIGANKYVPKPNDPPQHLVDLLDPTEDFSAANYFKLCCDRIQEVSSRNKVPIVVGGTGFYFDWLINGRPSAPAVSDAVIKSVRELVDQDANWDASLSRLHKVDPHYASWLLRNDRYRLIKAIGFHEQHGYPLSSCPRIRSFGSEYKWRCIYITEEREKIYRTIDLRCEQMIQQGLINETQSLISKGLLVKDSIAGRSIGYKETIDFLEKMPNADDRRKAFLEYLDGFSAATRQYARKQEQWFANKFKDEFVWISKSNDLDSLVDTVYRFCVADSIDHWVDESRKLKNQFRSASEKEKRRKRMRDYSPDYVIYNDHNEIDSVMSVITHK